MVLIYWTPRWFWFSFYHFLLNGIKYRGSMFEDISMWIVSRDCNQVLIPYNIFWSLWESPKQWPLAGEFVKFEYSPKIRQIFVTRSGKFGKYWANFCDSLRQIWRVLSKFGKFGKFGEFGEGRLDRFIHKKIFYCI